MDLQQFLNLCTTRIGIKPDRDSLILQKAPDGKVVSIKGNVTLPGNLPGEPSKVVEMFWNPNTGKSLNTNDIRYDLVFNTDISDNII